MKANKRVPTQQTNKSKKKAQKIQHQNPSLQLPKITKSSNYDTNSNISYDYEMDYEKDQNEQLDKIQQNQKQEHGVVNYQKMTMEEIKNQYQRLRQQVATLTTEVKRREELFQSKLMKKQSRIYCSQEKEKQILALEQQIYDNSYILNKLRQQYQQIQKRSNLANSSISRPNIEINDKIIDAKSKILNIKQKIKLLKRKTKKGGDDIVNGEDIHQILQKLQRQQKSYLFKHSSIQAKLQQSIYKLQREQQKLNQIENSYTEAENYLKLFKLQNEEVVEKNNLYNQLKQREHKQQILRKKIQSDQQTYLQKYHSLLKAFQLQSQKLQKLDQKLINQDVKILKNQNIILDLQQQQNQLQDILSRLNQQSQLKRQAQNLRELMQNQQNNYTQATFMTGYGFASTNSHLNTHLNGVKSIIQENQSQVRDTIQGSKELLRESNEIEKGNDKLLFKKVENSNIKQFEAKKQYLLTTKSIEDGNSYLKEQKYFVSSKQISKRRQQVRIKGNLTGIRKNGSTTNSNPVRKALSVIKPAKQPSKLKQLSLNRTSNNQSSARKISKANDQKIQSQPVTAKRPYIDFNKNSHKMQMEKGKQVLRQRKSSLKIVNREQEKNYQIKKNLIAQLEQINMQLTGDLNVKQSGEGFNIDKHINNQQNRYKNAQEQVRLNQTLPEVDSKKSVRKIELSSQQAIRKSSKIIKPGSKQGVIRNQKSIIKPQMLQQMDKRNMDYSKKIEELKKQIANGQSESLKQINSNLAVNQKKQNEEQRKQQLKQEIVIQQNNQFGDNKISAIQPIPLQSKKEIQQKIDNKVHDSIDRNKNEKKQEPLQQDLQVQSQQDVDDDDIENDISEINNMIKMKLNNPVQNQAVV